MSIFVPVFDATAKPPSGILSGNGNQYGDFDECLGIDGAVRGKYCLAYLQVDIGGEKGYDQLDTLIHSGHYIKSNVTDVSINIIYISMLKIQSFCRVIMYNSHLKYF